MSNFIVLDVVIGLVFIYLLYSLLATIIQELLATLFSFRSKLLERAICRMLDDDIVFDQRFSSFNDLFKKRSVTDTSITSTNTAVPPTNSGLFFKHPLMTYLTEGKHNSKPSYITKETFSKVLIDLLRGENLKPGDEVRPLIQQSLDAGKMAMSEFKIGDETLKYLKSIWIDGQGDVDAFRKLLEKWFDDTMERCTGWYKRHTQLIVFIIGFIIAIAFNVDTISITGKLQKDPNLRAAIVQQADAFIKEHPDLIKERANNLNENNIVYAKQDSVAGKAKADSMARAKNDSLLNRAIQLTHKADSIINTDIAKANGLLGLGWSGLKLTESIYCKSCKDEKTQDYWMGVWDAIMCSLSILGKCLLMLFGWLITAMALSLGAPFWFDLLNKFMKLRNSISIPTASQTKTKEGDPINKEKK